MSPMKILIAICVIISQPALAQSVGEKLGVNRMLGITPKTVDFIKEAASGEQFVIQSSQLAVLKTERKAKEFAELMVTEHTTTFNDLKGYAQKADVQLSTEMSISQKKSLNKLNVLSGDDFTQQYLDDQVAAHKQAMALFERYAKGGDNDALRAWVQHALSMLRQHLEGVQILDKSPN
jgi:putative membrane protein